ncbi:hypothetical protein BpHYR1_052623 [Brachionus plicatilis]|uniref:Uncharacterized protein n=1 Tax=Brachionus plicatilis TaxID=10195 RepID=A0A3M7R6L1_BRAPC|nr:hypothetical protein BpHYR1_052623 [Brachionus plicatilis]
MLHHVGFTEFILILGENFNLVRMAIVTKEMNLKFIYLLRLFGKIQKPEEGYLVETRLSTDVNCKLLELLQIQIQLNCVCNKSKQLSSIQQHNKHTQSRIKKKQRVCKFLHS